MAELGPIRTLDLPQMEMAAVVATVPLAQMSTAIKPLFEQFSAAMQAAGFVFWGPETALYRMEGDVMRCVIGVELDTVPEGLTRVSVPATTALCQRWSLTLAEFGDAHQALIGYAQSEGLAFGNWSREVYRALHGASGAFECDIILDLAAETA